MLLPGDELKVKVSRIGMCDGNIVVKIETMADFELAKFVIDMCSRCRGRIQNFAF
jgi:hypothetical protein